MRRTTVLYVIWALEMGGAEQVVAALARHLDRNRYRPVICCLDREGQLAGGLRADGVRVVALGKKPGIDPGIIPKLVRLMRQEQVALVHTHLWTANLWGRLAAVLAGVPAIVASEHSVDVWKPAHYFWIDRMLAPWTSKVVMVSDAVAEFYAERTGIKPPRGVRIYNGIDVNQFRPQAERRALRSALGLSNDAPVVITIGRLIPAKGHPLFIDAMVKVRKQCAGAVGLIVGDGEERAALDAAARAADGQGAVRLLGLRDDVPQLLAAADVFVLPSFREGFPITTLEAMAAGRPCVVTDVGGNAEAVVEGETGFIVPAGDVDALAARVSHLLGERALRERLGEAGRLRVATVFSVGAMMERIEQLYGDLLSETSRHSQGTRPLAQFRRIVRALSGRRKTPSE